tara:strand:+ start:148 stop:315 length:168 start_codon:yes stop_codon:yes gene_type:complete
MINLHQVVVIGIEIEIEAEGKEISVVTVVVEEIKTVKEERKIVATRITTITKTDK